MNNKNGCILVSFFGAMFLLQIWVAQAEGARDLKKLSPTVLQADLKLLKNNEIRKQVGLAELVEESEQQPKKSISGNGKKKVEKEVVWYNPWTWFK